MMSAEQFEVYLANLKIPEAGCEFLRKARGTPENPGKPYRNVESRIKNVRGRYISIRSGVTNDYESHRVERALLTLLERDPEILEFYTQVGPLPLEFSIMGGKKGYSKPDHVADVLVFAKTRIYFIEAKPLKQLEKSLQDGSARFAKSADGKWSSPAGEAAVKDYGCGYEVWMPELHTAIFLENVSALDAVTKRTLTPDHAVLAEKLLAGIASRIGVLLSDYVLELSLAERLVLEWLIGRGVVYCDLDNVRYQDAHRLRLYSDKRVATAFESAFPKDETGNLVIPKNYHARPTTTRLLGCNARDIELLVRNIRLNASGFSDGSLSPRQVRRLKAAAKKAIAVDGNPVAGLCGSTASQGNFSRKLANVDKIEALAKNFLKERYENQIGVRASSIWPSLKLQLKEANLPVPSRNWYYSYLKRYRSLDSDRVRMGEKAVYFRDFASLEGIAGVHDVHGYHPFDSVLIDSTPLEVIVIDEASSLLLGSPWLHVMMDVYTGDPLAYYLSFMAPSVSQLIMLFRKLVLVHGFFPNKSMTDNGSEYLSKYYEILTARFKCEAGYRPPSTPRFGAMIERLFGVLTSQLLYSMLGNKQRLHRARQLLAKDHPEKDAVWTLPDLEEAIEAFFAVKAGILRPALGLSPDQCRARFKAENPRSLVQAVKYDEDFLLATLTPSRYQTAKVMRGWGVKYMNYYYSSPELKSLEGQSVDLFVDDDDITRVYAKHEGRMIIATSKHAGALQGYSRRELSQYTRLFRRRYRISQVINERGDEPVAKMMDRIFEMQQAERVRLQAVAERKARDPKLTLKIKEAAYEESLDRLEKAAVENSNAGLTEDDDLDLLRAQASGQGVVKIKKKV